MLVDAFLGLHLLLRGLQGPGPLNVHQPTVGVSEQQILEALLDLGLAPHVEVEPGPPRGGSCWVLGPRGRTHPSPKRWLLGRRECSVQSTQSQMSVEAESKAYVALGELGTVPGCPGAGVGEIRIFLVNQGQTVSHSHEHGDQQRPPTDLHPRGSLV